MGGFAFSYFFLLLMPFFFAFAESAGTIGVNYGRVADNLPPPSNVVQLLKSQGISRVKLFDTYQPTLTALAGSGISVVVTLQNELLSTAASDPSFADSWVLNNVSAYIPSTDIIAIAVGNEVFADGNATTTSSLVPAMSNIYSSLAKHNISSISVSTPIALSSLGTSYPASAGAFKQELAGPVIKPMLDFLRRTGSYLMVNAYPFFAYSANADTISIDYALFSKNPGVVDSGSGLTYYNMLDAQIDAVYAAMSALQYDDVRIVVTETGWPSKGDENEVGAGPENAAAYNGNLVKRVLSGNGTPRKPNQALDVYLFALFNEDQKPGPTSERNYGLFYPNEQKVYNIPLTLAQLASWQSATVNDSKAKDAPAPTTGDVPAASSPSASKAQTWCVANGRVAAEKLQAALDYACSEGGADCRPIQPGATCYDPNTLEAHASYAFNSYYQKNAHGSGTCYFGGAAYVVSQPPRYGNCQFPTGY